ncbi:MAG: aldose 1-epimerase family protein [Eubacterium sp.]
MLHTIKNNELTIQINSLGAELKSIKDNESGREYMWSGNEKYWGKTSPILFPFVGSLKNGEYSYDGKTYKMSRHGFAREMEFELVSQKDNLIVFALENTKETLEKYPFQFRLEIEYEISQKNIKVKWRVINKDYKKMYFSIGGHPAFACPVREGFRRTDCFIKFNDVKEIKTTVLEMASGLITGEYKTYPLESGLLSIDQTLFDDDALIIENNQADTVSLCDENKVPYLTVKFDAPLFGIWSVPDSSASYVCIEPWYGRCDSKTFEGELQDRDWTNSIDSGKMFEREYEICINI